MDKNKKYVIQFVVLGFLLIGIVTLYNMNAQSTKTLTTTKEVTEYIEQDQSQKEQSSQKSKNHQSTANQNKTKNNQEQVTTNSSKEDKPLQNGIHVSIVGTDGIIASGVIEYNHQSAFDVLKSLCVQNNIPIQTTGSGITVYVKSIHGLAERDYGMMSGWKYKVNGEYQGIGAGQYQVKENDKVEWIYDKAE